MSNILNNRIYYINSKDRVAGTSSNFTYDIDIPDGSNFDSVCVLQMTIPKSYYLVRTHQNLVTLSLDGVSYPILVPLGNYNATTFTTALLALLNAASSNVFSMALSTTTGKFTYSYVGSAAVVQFIFTEPNLAHLMGFDLISTNTFVSNILVSSDVVDFVSTSSLFLHSDMVEDQSSILQELYVDNAVAFSNLVYQCKNPDMYSKTLKNTGSGVFNFSLTDENDLEVLLNGHDILVTLLLYKRENLTRLMKAIFVR